mmetsp:Transcript_15814/g.31047  ORF Transcript_15814/g.31047 Transcript_15814/m.31047 type:complete len:206 (-) Transcript_15814:30-647(-)
MAWYAKQPPPRPDWDTCLDFAVKKEAPVIPNRWGDWNHNQGFNYQGKKDGNWQNWADDTAWWPWGIPHIPWAATAFYHEPHLSGDRTLINPAAVGADDPDDAEFKSLLEKRLKESGSSRRIPPTPPAPSPTKEYEGSLKSLSSRNGYGFIVCQEAHSVYGRDVYLPEENVPQGAEVRDRLKFTITLSSKGHPQALNVRIVGRGHN